MANYLEEAQAMQHEIVAHRRYLHQHAELGFALTETVDYVCQTLRGYHPRGQDLPRELVSLLRPQRHGAVRLPRHADRPHRGLPCCS